MLNRFFRLRNTIQSYAWGSYTAIGRLLGQDKPSAQPQAELWMGAHPKAPSMVWHQEHWQRLDVLIQQFPREILGNKIETWFGPQLPFLFKVLAAAQPLSIQAHPSEEQARQGYAKENKQGIGLDAPHRNYKDQHHKPECICALTPFWALCGFRPIHKMLPLLEAVWPEQIHDPLLDHLRNADDNGLKLFFHHLMTMKKSQTIELIAKAVKKAQGVNDQDTAFQWCIDLNERYPGDIGVLSPLMLNLVQLQPGQALFLPSGQLHAYLDGLGIELMANSDNVLRGGLTPKHVDTPELMRILDFNPLSLSILGPKAKTAHEGFYASQAKEFVLSVIELENDTIEIEPKGVEILLCTQGQVRMTHDEDADEAELGQGQSVLIPAAIHRYQLNGQAVLYKAAVNI